MTARRSRGPTGGSTFRSDAPSQPSQRSERSPPAISSPRLTRLSRAPRGNPEFNTLWPQNNSQREKTRTLAQRPAPTPSPLVSSPLNKDFSQRLSSNRSREASARSTPSHIAIARRQREEALVNKEISSLFQQVNKDVSFNREDELHGHEAERIVANQKPEERGVIPEHARILHEEALKGQQFDAKREETPDAKDMWRQNRNPGLKWWQSGPVTELNQEQRKNLGLEEVSSAHPAYFLMRRKPIGLDYVEKPKFKSRSELFAQRKEALKPDASYDLDGDGVVGVREFYFAARMDKDVSGQLDHAEKMQGLDDLRKNIGNVMFVDNAGKAADRAEGNQYRVIQQDGKIVLDQQ